MSYKLADGTLSTDYKIGDLFITNDPEEHIFSVGSLVKFTKDDGSSCPNFELVFGKITAPFLDQECDIGCTFEDWSCLKAFNLAEQPELYTQSELTYIEQLEDEIARLNDLCSNYTKIIAEKDYMIKMLQCNVI